MRRRVVMLGSGPGVRGGVSAMVEVLREEGLFARWELEAIATHCDGSAARKAMRAARAWLRFAGLLAARRVALVHVHLNSGASFWRKALFAVPARWARVPTVMHVHCGRFPAFVASLGPRGRAFARWLLEGAAATVVLSRAARAALRAELPALSPEVIPNPVRIAATPRAPVRDPEALYLGMLTEAKGLDVLLAAWPRVAARVPGARLVLAGGGDAARWRAQAQALGVAASVQFAGWVHGAAKEALLARAALLVLPSRREAMPMAVLEAMGRGVPVVASAVGAIPEMLAAGEGGRIVPAGDADALAAALVELLSDPERAECLGRRGRERAEAVYAAPRVVPRLEALYRRFAPGCARMVLPDHAGAGSRPDAASTARAMLSARSPIPGGRP